MVWNSPFSLPGTWYKGNLHTHTTQSDGERTPEQAIEWYGAHGYDFLAITDHWVHTTGQLVRPGLLLLSGAELHGPGYHMVALGARGLPDMALADDPRALADEVRLAGGLPFFAHPYWTGQTVDDLLAAPAVAGIEVYNTVCDRAYGLGYARVHWDGALSQGKRLVGLATDDVHWRYGEEGKAFVMVRAEALEERAILQALERGMFYSSTGPRILDLRLVELPDGSRGLRVACSPCRYITFHAHAYLGRRFWASDGPWLDAAIYPLRPELRYLRIECGDDRGGIAWTNPVFMADVFA
ncbi:MAG: CehA/McbA family metallohydrolase [Chloroflexi bacterium]|nr:CehA/McbA family metallohydrolase [Chloroflexota bacterium]